MTRPPPATVVAAGSWSHRDGATDGSENEHDEEDEGEATPVERSHRLAHIVARLAGGGLGTHAGLAKGHKRQWLWIDRRRQFPLVDQCQGSPGRLRNPYRPAFASSQRYAGLPRERMAEPL